MSLQEAAKHTEAATSEYFDAVIEDFSLEEGLPFALAGWANDPNTWHFWHYEQHDGQFSFHVYPYAPEADTPTIIVQPAD